MRAVPHYQWLFSPIDVESNDYPIACNFGTGEKLPKMVKEARAAMVGFDENENGVADMVRVRGGAEGDR
jgi:hypothetical protein